MSRIMEHPKREEKSTENLVIGSGREAAGLHLAFQRRSNVFSTKTKRIFHQFIENEASSPPSAVERESL